MAIPERERVLAAIAEAGGSGLIVTALDGEPPVPRRGAGPGVIRLATHRRGNLPTQDLESFDLLLSGDPAAPRPWVGVAADRFDETLEQLRQAITLQPAAASVTAQTLRTTLKVTFEEAVVAESLAYSMLLGSDAFRAWRVQRPVRLRADDDAPRVLLTREDGALNIRLNRPRACNAVDSRMRDALFEALDFAAQDPDGSPVVLSGEGAAFSAGGDLDEFGQADDPARAHLIRALRAPARLLHHIRDRVTARLHGACFGAGVEIPAAAGRVLAHPDTVFRLPELSMGLIPGACGTATIPRRIGRQRTCFMSLTGTEVDARTALAWGLVDALEPA